MRPSYSIMMIALLLSGSITLLGSIQEQRMDNQHKIIAVACSGSTFSQSVTTVVQTSLSLLVVYNDFGHTLGLGANLTATDGSPITGATITFYLQQVSRHPPTDSWLELGASATDDAGVATLGLALFGFYGPCRVKASHEQDINFSGAESIVDVVFPSGQAVHIRSDGSIDPSNAAIKRNGDLYTLTGDIVADSGGISIERDNIVLDGGGHMIKPLPHIIGNYGISLVDRTNVTVENIQTESFSFNIELSNSTNNTITKNKLTKSEYAATILEATGATFALGFFLDASSNNTISENEVNSIEIGGFFKSSSNKIYYNNFINHTPSRVSVDNSENTWDDGYPFGGNYWSDYNGTDLYRGPYQNLTGSDGIGDTPYVIDSYNLDNYPLMNPWSPHDIAVTNLTPTKTVIIQGDLCNLNVAIANLGGHDETFNVTAYANMTAIGVQTVTVSAGNSATIVFTWNTAGFALGNYTIEAVADTVLGETNTTNNILTYYKIAVTIPGDLNGDFQVDLADLVLLAVAYGSRPGDPNWNSNADLAMRGIIDLTDLVTLAMHYGQHYP